MFRAAVLLLALLVELRPAGARGEMGPLPTSNLAPHHLFLLEPRLGSSSVLAAGSHGIAVDLAYATIFVSERAAAGEVLFDMEVARLGLRYAYGLSPRVQLAAEVPLYGLWAGPFDSLLLDYHRIVRLPTGNRKFAPTGRFDAFVTDGRNTFSPDSDGRVGLGDSVLEVKAAPAFGRKAALRAQLKLPTGDPGHGLGSGKADVSLGALLGFGGGKVSLRASVDGVYLGGSPDPVLRMGTHWAAAAAAAGGIRLGSLGTALLQVDYFTTPYDTGLTAIDRDVLQLAVGLERKLRSGILWGFGITEDLLVESSPDFSVFVFMRGAVGP